MGSLSYEGVKFGYDFKNAPLSIYGGLNTFKYNVGPGASSPFAAFESTSGTVPGYTAQAGVEIRPTSNLSLSLGVGYTDLSQTASTAISDRPCCPAPRRLPSAAAARSRLERRAEIPCTRSRALPSPCISTSRIATRRSSAPKMPAQL